MEAQATAMEPAGDEPSGLMLDLLRHEHERIEPRLEEMLRVLARQGAREIWHKHGTFHDHLLGVWRILVAWRQPADVCRLGLMHSVYSNSFVRMKVFDAEHAAGRETVRDLIGEEAERLVYTFCEIRREELLPFGDQAVPADGIRVGLHHGEGSVQLSRRELGIFLVVTMADYAEQFFGWQDRLFALPERDGTRRGGPHALWPGESRPGLWMGLDTKLGLRAAACGATPLPPVFAGCTATLERDAENEARDLYWQVVSDPALQDDDPAHAEGLLRRAGELNPFVAEPHVLRAQLCVTQRRWDEAAAAAAQALALQAQWATAWDKRLAWEAWVAWTRVLLKAARERSWPDDAMGVISLGEVRTGR